MVSIRLTVPFAIVIVLFAGLVQAAPEASAAATHTVSGKVVSDAGAPLAGVSVSGWSSSPNGESYSDQTVTGDDGTFSLKLGEGKAAVNAWLEEWRANAESTFEVDGDVGGIVLTLKTPPPRTALVEGKILDAKGNPVEGATVTLQGWCCHAYDTPGAAPPGPSTTVMPAEEENETSVSSDVGGSSGASPGVAESRIAPDYYWGGDHQTATTGADGAYSFKTYEGPRQITAWAKGYAQSDVQVDAKDGETVRQDLTIEKVPAADAIVKGRVVDSRTGAPLANAGVSISNLEWGRSDWRQTGSDGSFEFTTLPGWTQLSVYYYGYDGGIVVDDGATDAIAKPAVAPQQYYPWVSSFRVSSGANDVDVKLERKPDATVALVGYVVDPDKEAGVAGAYVSVWNQDTGDWGSAVTDATGSFRILVRPGHYHLNAHADGHLPGSEMFTISEGEATKRVDVETPAGTQKWAPCDECDYGRPMPMMARSYAETSKAPAASTAGAPAADGAKTDGALTTGASSPESDSTRAAAYSGSGGGLPPYDAETASEEGGSGATPKDAAVPGLALGVALVVVGAVALALRRR